MSQTSPKPVRRASRPSANPGSGDARWACLGDAVLLAGAFGLNFWVWLGFVRLGHIPSEYVRLSTLLVVPLVALRLALLAVGGLYRSRTPHLGFHELTVIALANTAATAALIVFNLMTPWIPSLGAAYPLDAGGTHVLRLPWGIVLNDWMFSLLALGGIRFLRHHYEAWLLRSRGPVARRTLIVGTGDAAARVGRDLFHQTAGGHLPVGLIDPEGENAGSRIHGLKVLGGLGRLREIVASARADEIVLALDQPSPRVVGEVLRRIPPNFPSLKLVPDLNSLMSGSVTVSALRPVGIEDLLGRSAGQAASRRRARRPAGPTGPDHGRGRLDRRRAGPPDARQPTASPHSSSISRKTTCSS
jgi:FlaA1/EpsC-like NDP-sugar epimerase